MCGRFSQTKGADELEQRFNLKNKPARISPRYNIAPSQDAAIIVNDGGNQLHMMRWGLIPHWAKDKSIGFKMINARAETVTEKPSFKKSFQNKRCLVATDGFYEWVQNSNSKVKIPMRITQKGGELFSFAGLWDIWKSPEGPEIRSFTIITTTANELLKPIHERMPVILNREEEQSWLDNSITDIPKLLPMLKQYPAHLMQTFPVSTLVNSPRNDVPGCITPA